MNITEFIQQFYMPIIIVACLCVGYIIKKINFIPDKYIPLIMGVLGVVFAFISNGISFEIFVCGLFSGLASTGMHQIFKQIIKDDDYAI